MLTDYWVIIQLLAQICSLILLAIALRFGIISIRFWNAKNANEEQQITLERQDYLVSSIAKMVLSFQFLALLMFLATVNLHFPNLIRGAMCATGTLSANNFGYPLLFLKLFFVIFACIFSGIQNLDSSQPAYPLSPQKYVWLFPSFLFLLADLVLMFAYFSNINPDLITTCCSLNFVTDSENHFLDSGHFLKEILLLFAISYIFLMIFALKKKAILQFFSGLIFVFSAIYTLKYFFVKYIYGLPSHFCLFDLFFANNFYVGYLFFGLYYFLLKSLINNILYHIFRKKLNLDLPKTNIYVLIYATLIFLIPTFYWLFWKGDL